MGLDAATRDTTNALATAPPGAKLVRGDDYKVTREWHQLHLHANPPDVVAFDLEYGCTKLFTGPGGVNNANTMAVKLCATMAKYAGRRGLVIMSDSDRQYAPAGDEDRKRDTAVARARATQKAIERIEGLAEATMTEEDFCAGKTWPAAWQQPGAWISVMRHPGMRSWMRAAIVEKIYEQARRTNWPALIRQQSVVAARRRKTISYPGRVDRKRPYAVVCLLRHHVSWWVYAALDDVVPAPAGSPPKRRDTDAASPLLASPRPPPGASVALLASEEDDGDVSDTDSLLADITASDIALVENDGWQRLDTNDDTGRLLLDALKIPLDGYQVQRPPTTIEADHKYVKGALLALVLSMSQDEILRSHDRVCVCPAAFRALLITHDTDAIAIALASYTRVGNVLASWPSVFGLPDIGQRARYLLTAEAPIDLQVSLMRDRTRSKKNGETPPGVSMYSAEAITHRLARSKGYWDAAPIAPGVVADCTRPPKPLLARLGTDAAMFLAVAGTDYDPHPPQFGKAKFAKAFEHWRKTRTMVSCRASEDAAPRLDVDAYSRVVREAGLEKVAGLQPDCLSIIARGLSQTLRAWEHLAEAATTAASATVDM